MAPIAPGFEVTEIERVLKANLDAGDSARDLARHEGLAADRALMIEQDAIRGIPAVRLAVIDRDPVAVKLRDAIGRARIERRGFLLWNFLNKAVKLGSRSLIEPRLLLHPENPDRLQQPQHTDAIGIRG